VLPVLDPSDPDADTHPEPMTLAQERCVLDVARDIAKIFDMSEDKIVHVKDRAFNDQCAPRP